MTTKKMKTKSEASKTADASGGILDMFTALGDLDPKQRAATVQRLMDALLRSSAADAPGGGQAMSEDLRYALKRLVRGLSSYRDAARQGFALGLSQVLVSFSFSFSF